MHKSRQVPTDLLTVSIKYQGLTSKNGTQQKKTVSDDLTIINPKGQQSYD